MKGFVQIPRAFFDSEIWRVNREFSKAEAWIDLVQQASFKDRVVNYREREINLKKGEVHASLSYLGKRWNWTIKKVRVFLDKVESNDLIYREKRSSIIGIYDFEMLVNVPKNDIVKGTSKGTVKDMDELSITNTKSISYEDNEGQKGISKGTIKGNNKKKGKKKGKKREGAILEKNETTSTKISENQNEPTSLEEKSSESHRSTPKTSQVAKDEEIRGKESRVARNAKKRPSSINEVKDHMITKGLTEAVSQLEAQKFFYFYESKGWMVGKSPMKVWKSAASRWALGVKSKAQNQQRNNHQPHANAGSWSKQLG